MRLATKLWVLAGLPLTILLFETASSFLEQNGHRTEATAVARMADLAGITGDLLHESQKERGMSSGFLGAKKPELLDALRKQRATTDERVAAFLQTVHGLEADPTTGPRLQPFRDSIEQLGKAADLRRRVDSLAATTAESFGFYTSLNKALLDGVGAIESEDGALEKRFRNLLSLQRLKELTGVERALANAAFRRGSFAPDEYRKLVVAIGAQDAWSVEFARTAEPWATENASRLAGMAEVVAADAMRKTALESGGQGALTVDAEAWWRDMTTKIDAQHALEIELTKTLQQRCAAAIASATAHQGWVAAIGVFAFVLTGCITRLLSRAVVLRPLQRLTDAFERMATGDLVHEVEVRGNDEIAATAGRLRTFQQGLRATIHDIADRARQVTSAGEQLTATATELRTGAGRTKDLSMQAAAAAQQMSTNMATVGQSADAVAQSFRTIAAAVEEMTASIGGVAASSTEGANVADGAAKLAKASNGHVAELGKGATEIGRVVELIQDIAEQTNLLALNATIEAARAGEAGRGFAVVAGEVKALAQQTASATEDIRQRIARIRTSTTETVGAIGAIDAEIAKVSSSARGIATAVGEQRSATAEIAQNLGQSTRSVEVVVTNVRESAAASREIDRAVTEVDAQARSTSQAADETRNAGQLLADVAVQLSGLVERFRT